MGRRLCNQIWNSRVLLQAVSNKTQTCLPTAVLVGRFCFVNDWFTLSILEHYFVMWKQNYCDNEQTVSSWNGSHLLLLGTGPVSVGTNAAFWKRKGRLNLRTSRRQSIFSNNKIPNCFFEHLYETSRIICCFLSLSVYDVVFIFAVQVWSLVEIHFLRSYSFYTEQMLASSILIELGMPRKLVGQI
jgi:hypothetical protein